MLRVSFGSSDVREKLRALISAADFRVSESPNLALIRPPGPASKLRFHSTFHRRSKHVRSPVC